MNLSFRPRQPRPRSATQRRAGASALLAVAFLAVALQAPSASAQTLRPVTVAQGLEHPWGLAFLPDFERKGEMLVTERPGRLRVVRQGGTLSEPLAGLPRIDAGGQGGLLDVALAPDFASSRWVYFSFSEAAQGGGESGNSTAVARGKLSADQTRLDEVQVIFRQAPKVGSRHHFGGRLVFARDGTLYLTLGDRYSRRDDAQTLDNHQGKIVRIAADGTVPADNPFARTPNARPEIYSYGHRNVQGAALHPVSGELWTHEHGPQGGDEVNRVLPGRNYGWPKATRGVEYVIGTQIGQPALRGMEEALTTWVPSIAPSGMAFVTGTAEQRYPEWKGNLFVGALRGQALVRLTLEGNKITGEQRLLQDQNARIRDVRFGPDGWMYLLTDAAKGRVVRVER